MRKLLVVFLALVMLVPTGLTIFAGAEDEFTTQPFYALGWSDFDEEKYPYLDGLVTANFTNIGDTAKLSYGGVSLTYGQYTDEQVTKFAQAMKETMDARPAGTRYWHVFGPTKILKLAPKNALYLDHGIKQIQDLFKAAITKMAEIGCPLDGVVVDTEYIGMSSWYLYANTDKNSNNYQKNKNIYADIVNDPRYATYIRPLLEERGFPFWPNPSGEKSEIYTICNLNKDENAVLARSIWDTVVRIHINRYVNYWCYDPLREAYPEASLSDYQSHDSKPWLKLAGITDDGVALTGGNSIRVGTASSFSYYYARPGASFYEDMKQYVGYNDAVFEASAYNTFMYDINFTRHMYTSTDTKQIAPWITSYMYGTKKDASIAYTHYYPEQLYHLGMFDPEPFLSYTYVNEYKEDDGTISYTSSKYLSTQQVMNEIMAELTRVAGYSDRKPIEMPQYWNAEFVISGMYAGGRNIWRITPNTDEISREDFLVEGDDPTFSVKGQTVTFPGGKIWDEGTFPVVGSCGYWVETPADSMPVYTNDPDRYTKYPSFLMDFEDCAVGPFNASNANPSKVWEFSWDTQKGDLFSVVETANGKALSFYGNSMLRNNTLASKITAGDSYAEDQIWEITVTVPEGLSSNAEIIVLKYGAVKHLESSDKQVLNDGGIKISGGKIYASYLNDGDTDYKELAAAPAGTYVLRRVLNLHDEKNSLCSYYVLDTEGNVLGSAEDLTIPNFDYANTIDFSTKNADVAVLFDDFKLCIAGLTTDFELYDAKTGMNVKGDAATTARDRSTAFRLSWCNATAEEKVYTISADIYQDGVLVETRYVKEVKMLPGYDAVETGVVEIAEGQSVLVYLAEGGIPVVPEAEVENPINPLYFVLGGVVLLALIAIVLALVLGKKKKAAPQAAEADETAAVTEVAETPETATEENETPEETEKTEN